MAECVIQFIPARDDSTVVSGFSFSIGDKKQKHFWQVLSDGLDGFGEIRSTVGYNEYTNLPGAYLTNRHEGARDLTIKAVYDGADKQAARDEVIGRLAVGSNFNLYITYNGRTRQCYAFVVNISVPTANIYEPLTLTVTLRMLEPYFRGSYKQGDSEYERNFSAKASTLTATITDQMAPSPYVIKATAATALTGFELMVGDNWNAQKDVAKSADYALAAGDVLEFNSKGLASGGASLDIRRGGVLLADLGEYITSVGVDRWTIGHGAGTLIYVTAKSPTQTTAFSNIEFTIFPRFRSI